MILTIIFDLDCVRDDFDYDLWLNNVRDDIYYDI